MSVLISLLVACGAQNKDEMTLSGSVTVPASLSAQAAGPLFVGVSRTDNVDLMQSDPLNQIVTMVPADGSSFSIDLTTCDVQIGEEVFVFAFADNDYTGGVPNPTPGDVIGFYVNNETLSTKIKLTAGTNSLNLNANRLQYDISPEVIGLIDGTDSGEVILIAYAGNFNSLNFTDLDTDAIIGYQKFYKGAAPCLYSLKIMPYITPEKYSMPIKSVYIIALLDKNGNGVPDAGDSIGFPINGTDGDYPMAINIQNAVNSTTTVYFKKTISAAPTSTEPLKISGTFDAPSGYDSSSPMFFIVAKSSDPNEVFTNMLDTVKYFKNVTSSYNSSAGTFSFDEDLSSSGLASGDTVMIIALWDKDFVSGLPEATAGDIVGFIQNKSAFAFTVQLNSGTNTITKTTDSTYLYNGTTGYDFSLKRTVYDHDATIKFKLEQGTLTNTEFANGNLVQVIVLYDATSYTLTTYSSFKTNINMDNIIGSKSVLIEHDLDATVTSRYTMAVMPAIPTSITGISTLDFSIPNIYVVAFLDANGNGKPDTGEKIAFYYKNSIATLYQNVPDKITLVDGANVISSKNVKFSQTY